MAPVPHSARTKLAIQIGTSALRERVDRLASRVEAFLVDRAGEARLAVERAEPADVLPEHGGVGRFPREAIHHRMPGASSTNVAP